MRRAYRLLKGHTLFNTRQPIAFPTAAPRPAYPLVFAVASMSTVTPFSTAHDELSALTVTPANRPTDFSPSNKTPPIYDHASKQFDNPWPTWQQASFSDTARMMWQSSGDPLAGVDLERALPVVQPQWGSDDGRVYYTWLGHASALVQLYGVNVLIDPIFSQRCAPVQFAGPKRYRPAPCSVEQLPPIDVVLISHNHYDHLDLNSCRQLADKAERQRKETGRTMKWYVGKGIEEWLVSNCQVRSEDATGMLWWQETQHTLSTPATSADSTTTAGESTSTSTTTSSSSSSTASSSSAAASGPLIRAVPCQHMSVRSPLTDFRRTLWCGFTVTHRSFTLFYSGDTAYCASFKQIGHHTPHIDLAVLPIGAYEPWWFMKNVHVAPAQAVDMMEDIKADRAVAVHWGTFILTKEPVMEPKEHLEAELKKRGIDSDKFVVTKHGETILIK